MQLTLTDIEKLFEVHHFFLNNPGNRYSLSLLSELFQVDVNMLKEGYQIIFGQKIQRARIKITMEMAQRDLQNGALVKEVAWFYGYKNTRSFYNAFKRVMGVSPVRYKKK